MNIPDMVPVTSSAISEIGYDATAQRLFVRFASNALWAYDNVPLDAWQQAQGIIARGDSIGSWYNRHVRQAYMGKLVD